MNRDATAAATVAALSEQLSEAQATIDAIRNGDVDAVVVGGPDGQRVYTLDNVDRPYRVIVEQMQEGAVTLGTDGLILYCNRRFATLVGQSAGALVGHLLPAFAVEPALLAALLAAGGAGEILLSGAHGPVPVNVSIVALAGEDDLRCAVVTDLTQVKARQTEALATRDRLAAEVAERRRAEEGLLFALDAAGMGSWNLDLVTRTAQRSRRHDEVFGYPDGAAAWGLDSALDHFIDDDRPQVAAAFATAELTGELDFEHRIRRASDGQVRWLHVKGQTVVADGRPVRIAGVVSDVTDQRVLDDQIRQVQKMDAVGQLTGGIAHDFNNLLTIVVGNMDMAERALDAADPARARRAVVNARKGAERAAVLTQRLLAFSRRTTLDPRVLDINKLVVGMADLLGRSLGETVELQTVTGAGLWRIEADPHQLENALLNLAVNARDAMPGGGKLTIETQNMWIDEAYSAMHREVAPGQYVAISVSDTGTGMPPDVIARAFDPFFTTKEVGKGTGLGLSQVYGYVKQTGGHVNIYSEPGEGTMIRIYLPRSARSDADVEPDAPREAERGAAETILVVEDDDDVRTYTVESLRELGYRVLEAHDGPSALRLLDRQEMPVRLLFTDVVMPGMSGRELKDAALLRQPTLKVLFTTGYARSAIDHGGRLEPGVDLVAKPFNFAELAAKVRAVLDKGNRDRLLVIAPDAAAQGLAAAAAQALGLRIDVAHGGSEALGRVRAAGGDFDAVIVDDGFPAVPAAIVTELRAIRHDLPILIVVRGAGDDTAFADDPCTGFLRAPYDAEALCAALVSVRWRCHIASADPPA